MKETTTVLVNQSSGQKKITICNVITQFSFATANLNGFTCKSIIQALYTYKYYNHHPNLDLQITSGEKQESDSHHRLLSMDCVPTM